MKLVTSLWGLLSLLVGVVSVSAEPTIDRVRSRGVLLCGGVARPGLAENHGVGWTGLEIDLGRAVATAVLGSADRVEFHLYANDADFTEGTQTDDVLFLTGSEIVAHGLAGQIVPGPTVFVEAQGVMVPGNSVIHHLTDLTDHTVCFLIGSPGERALNAFFQGRGPNFFRRPFSEVGEMVDAYSAQNGEVLVGEVTDLAAVRTEDAVRPLESRILPETLENYPIIAATGTADGRWSSLVAWTIHALVSGERPETPWFSGGAQAMPIDALKLGLTKGWQTKVLQEVGTYGELFDRNLGSGSALHLDRGTPKNRLETGLILSPFVE